VSDAVTGWVKEHGPHRQPDYGVLREIADHAGSHHGVDQAYAYPGTELLARESRWSKTTVLEAIRSLEDTGFLLVRRPSDRGTGRGTGRHSEYVVLMGRDAHEVAERLGWPLHERSATHTDRGVGAHRGASAPNVDDDAMDGVEAASDACDDAQAAPPATCGQPATAPVDVPFRGPDERSATRTVSTSNGVRSVFERSSNGAAHGTELELEQEQLLDLAHGTHRGRARGTVKDVDELLDDVRRRLASLAPAAVGVRWDVTAGQRQELAVHAMAWPTLADAAADWAITAATSIVDRGRPFSARAWVGPWLYVDPPAAVAGDTMCDEHALGDLAVPVRICAPCRLSLAVS
jgi:hypothetical protein